MLGIMYLIAIDTASIVDLSRVIVGTAFVGIAIGIGCCKVGWMADLF
jgi:hypothetical protein